MTEPIYANQEHRVIIESYITMCKEFAKDVGTIDRYENYLEVLDVIIEYSNAYGATPRESNWWDWLMIIPINLSVMTNGYFAGIETKKNAAVVRSYRLILNELVQDTVNKIDGLETIKE